MQPTGEIKALLRLIDDPDAEVYDTVAGKLLNYGKAIIPNLEALWETVSSEEVQERIETLIHRVHFSDLQRDFRDWADEPHPSLLSGALLVAQYQFPHMHTGAVLAQFDKMRRNIWLELNQYLTPLEQINVFNSIIYSYYKLQGHELTTREAKYFFLNQVFESRQGNGYSIGVLYLALAELLDIPIFAVEIPRQFLFAYVDSVPHFGGRGEEPIHHIQFYVDPISGAVYSQGDIDTYLRKINANDRHRYFTPLENRQVIWRMLEELALCYKYNRAEDKAEEIETLMRIISGQEPGESDAE